MAGCFAIVLIVIFVAALIISLIVLETKRDAPKNSLSSPTLRPTPRPTPIPEVNYRLSLNIKPINYNIHLRPYLNESDTRKFTFDGECFIEIQALQNTTQIQLHISNLNVSLSEYFKKDTNNKTVLPKATPNSLTDIVVYNLNEELQANVSYILHYVYFGSINEEVRGFYRSKYTTKNATKWFGATQLEPMYARCVFPSFDEPNFKATFDFSLTYDRSFESMGPTALDTILLTEDHKTVNYSTTSIMPTYFLTFTVSEFYFRYEGQLGVIARPEYSSQTNYSHECGKHLLAVYRNFFNTNLSTITESQIHLDAIPNSELAESVVLYDEDESSLKAKQVATNIVAYEAARLWWGKLVTCKWWSDTWLNEGFASYFQYFGTDLVDSSFNMSSQFVVDVIQNVMNQDATNDTRPISNENVRTKDDIIRMFNRISFLKAAAFIRMTKDILGEGNFRRSMNEYLTTYAYKNTIPSDLFNIWKKYWPFEYKQFSQKYFESFTTQVGYPVVTFKRTSEICVEVSQKRFLLNDFDKANTKLTHTVPITLTSSSKNNFKDVSPKFFLENNTFKFYVRSKTTWIIGNIQQSGYYRVNYDNNTWNEIGKKLFSESREDIHVFNRAQIVDDLFNLPRADELPYSVSLNTLQYLENETDYLPWAAAFKGFSYLMTRLGNESDIFVPFIREIIKNNYHIVGFKPTKKETTLEIYRRTNILAWSCKNIIPDCVYQAKTYFDEISKNRSVEVNIRSVVYCTVMREGNANNFNTLYNKYMTENVASEKNFILDSLSCVKDRELVKRFFQIIISNDLHAVDRTIALYNLCTKNNENVDHVFDLIDEQIEQLANATGGYYPVASLIVEIAEHFTTEAQLQKLKDFIRKHTGKFGRLISILQRAVNIVEENLKWAKENLNEIKSYMHQFMQRFHQ